MFSSLKPEKPSTDVGKDARTKERLELALEQGLMDTFPASDAVAVTEPAPTLPGDDNPARTPADDLQS